MNSSAFDQALKKTGFLLQDGTAAPGLVRSGEEAAWRLRPALADERIGLRADAVFSAHGTPTTIFKDAGDHSPTETQIHAWHEAAWNIGLAPLLWVITPTEVRLYNCYASARWPKGKPISSTAMDAFALNAEERLRLLDTMCGRLATETGAFWSSPIGQSLNRRHRVDRELLSEINALEERLTLLPPASQRPMFDDPLDELHASRDFAQRLIGRCIFSLYLVDRQIAQPFLPSTLANDVVNMFATVNTTFELFRWLRAKFNGDLFPMDDPGAEQQRLGEAHLQLLRDFIEGRSLVPGRRGQGRLFRFRYDAIPVDLISSIYQQFARSSAADTADIQGLHYTPVELVHLTLDPVFEGLPPSARVVDPTCGSGAFLVEAFRRLVWKNSHRRRPTRSLIRQILHNQLFGIDINTSALAIAAFSLYLAALELDEDPVTDVTDLRFDKLIGTSLFNANTIGGALPDEITNRTFDAVVGNPPWTFVSQSGQTAERPKRKDHRYRPRRTPDQEFLWTAAQLAGDSGRIGMIMKASPFFSQDAQAVRARDDLFRMLAPTALVNLSALRKEQLFPDATGPALLFFSRCSLMPQKDLLLAGSVPWSPDFRRTGVFQIGPGDLRTVPLARLSQTPALLKAASFGSARDIWLIEKLAKAFPTLNHFLEHTHIVSTKQRGQGFQVKGDLNTPPRRYYDISVVEPETYCPFRLDESTLPKFSHATLHRPREATIFAGPLLICPKGAFSASTQQGRYSAAISPTDLLYTESFYGISFANHDPDWAKILCAILNSSITTFQFCFAGGGWGLERPTVEPNDLLSLRVPDLKTCDPALIRAVLDAEASAASAPHSEEYLHRLDAAVFDLYGLEGDESVLAGESVARARMLIFESREDRMPHIVPPSPDVLTLYANETTRVVNSYLRARGKRHLQASIYERQLTHTAPFSVAPGSTVVKFSMIPGPSSEPSVTFSDSRELEKLARVLRGPLKENAPPYLNHRRQIRIYEQNELFILKPSEERYWTLTAGLNDADAILADHWISTENATLA
jgi:hypothetical protein